MSASRTFVYEPVVAFRGGRDYVHSTDIYEDTIRGASAYGLAFDGPIDLRIRSKITKRPYYRFIEGESAPSGEHAVAAQCRFHHKSLPWLMVLSERSLPVCERKPYDEAPAARHGVIFERTARLVGETGLRPIEAVTALAVLLHKEALPPGPGKRWMLGQLSLLRPLVPADAATLVIAIEKLAGAGTTRSSIAGHDGVLGQMIFVLARG